MALYFRNLYSDTVWVAFLYNDAGCGNVPFRKLGWWQVNSGETFNAWNTDLRNVGRYAAFYAEEYRDAGGATWNGSGNNWYLISDIAFDQCYSDNSNCDQQPDFVPLDFNGFSDVYVVLGPKAGELNIQGSMPPLPPQLDFDWNPIVFGGGVPVGGWSHLTIREDGTYSFTGHFHDSGGTEYNMSLVWAIKDSNNQVYTFEHSGHVSGTFESGSRDDTWDVDGQNAAIARNWASIVAADNGSAEASASGDLTSLVNSLIGTLGTVLGIVAIVVA
jgi:hypothetical protein